MKALNTVKITFPSRSVNEGFARSALSAFAAQADPTLDELADVKTAVSEAVTNCIVHAYANTIGPITLTAALYEDGTLRVAWGGREHDLVRACDLQIKGEHNVANALCAASAALALGVDARTVSHALAGFAPLEHRLEPCGCVAGVRCVNDSKATNVDATLKALAAFDDVRPVVLLGGRDKGTDLAPLVQAARCHAKAVVCFGEAARRFASAFQPTQSADAAAVCGAPSSPSKPSSRTEVRHALGSPSISGTGETLADSGSTGELLVLRAGHLEDALDAALSVASA